MCETCDGTTHEESMQGVHERIGRFGYTQMGIEADLDHPLWLFTIGLAENRAHPELSILGVPYRFGYAVLKELADRVLEGARFTGGEHVMAQGVYFQVEAVDPRLWDGDQFNFWKAYYWGWRDGPAPPPSAVELVLSGSQPYGHRSATARRPIAAERRTPVRPTPQRVQL